MSQIKASYQGLTVGALAEARGGLFFEYDRGFIASGHELSPLRLPLGPGLRSRDSPPGMQLPGLFEDSLPDAWGQRVMFEWFRRHGTPEHAVTPLTMLAYLGRRAMGALIYETELEIEPAPTHVSLRDLQEAAAQAEDHGPIDLNQLAEVGSSAGGARAKALLALPRDGSAEILPGAGELPASHEAWLVKFDTSRDRSAGPIEAAYARMAQAAAIDLPPTRFPETHHEEGLRRHFAVKRFDRHDGERIHHHTLAAMCHAAGGDLGYETLLRVTRHLTRDQREVARAYRRAVFNLLASNRDDHAKNVGFLYRQREWKLGPAYDLTFASPSRLPERGMSIIGERRQAGRSHLLALAEAEGLERRPALAIIGEVRAAIARWREFSAQAEVPPAKISEIESILQAQDKAP